MIFCVEDDDAIEEIKDEIDYTKEWESAHLQLILQKILLRQQKESCAYKNYY